MELRFQTIFLQSIGCSIFLSFSLQAGQVRISFLADTNAVQDTLEILGGAGCTEEARSGFAKAVERFNKTPFAFDYRKFPASSNGFYSFNSEADLVSALPHKLSDTKHPVELNCFDLAILVAGGPLRTSVFPYQACGPFLVLHASKTGEWVVTAVEMPIEAFNLLYPKWYQDATVDAFPESLHDPRVTLSAALFRHHPFPATNEQTLRDRVFTMLRTSWKSCAMEFPERFQLVLGHQVDVRKHQAVTDHAGLLFPRKKGYTYLEKSGATGPFVRLDIADKESLYLWFTQIFKGARKSGWTHHFVTFNDSEIQMIAVPE